MTKPFRSDPDNVSLSDAGWALLPSGVEMSRLPCWDVAAKLFARLGHGPASEWLASRGWRLPTQRETVEMWNLRASKRLEPYTMPTAKMLHDAGVDTSSQQAIDRYRNANMMTEAWCRIHDASVLSRLDDLGYDNDVPVINAGKHWIMPVGTIFGWLLKDGSVIQSPSRAHAGEPTYVDYATTFHAVRNPGATIPPPESDEAPPKPSTVPPAPPALRKGSKGPFVRRWQQVLLDAGHSLGSWGADGSFGEMTWVATKAWQRGRGLQDDGIVGPMTWAASATEPIPDTQPSGYRALVDEHIQARNYRKTGRDLSQLQAIVLHSTENAIRDGVAHNVAMWFGGPSAPMASAHFIVGPDQLIQCVALEDVAFAAPGMNRYGIQVEIVGQAAKSDWFGADVAVVERTAQLVAALCTELGLPVERVDADGLKRGERGITSHAAVTAAFGRSTHVDPAMPGDRRWDWPAFLAMVEEAM